MNKHRYFFGWIEEPFPWLPIVAATATALLVEGALMYAALSLFDCDILE